jgi:hypothetical protein
MFQSIVDGSRPVLGQHMGDCETLDKEEDNHRIPSARRLTKLFYAGNFTKNWRLSEFSWPVLRCPKRTRLKFRCQRRTTGRHFTA